MAPSRSTSNPAKLFVRFTLLILGSLALYTAAIVDLRGAFERFCTGPGSYSRILAAFLVVINWKSLPFAWNFRIWYCMIQHLFVRDFHAHTPDKLFHPVISESHASLGELDYRWHKSNSTYLADLDISRSHLVSHLVARAGHLVARNAKSRLVMDPSNPSKPARGSFNIGVGAVHCSFKREIGPYQRYEMWSRVLSWDRKWLYIVTHFVQKGAVRPRSWDGQNCGPTRKTPGKPQDWEKKVLATAVTSYVFKVGRLTIHPATILEASGLLPQRPGGWTSDTSGSIAEPPTSGDGSREAEDRRASADQGGWTWRRTEEERLKGLVYAQHFSAMGDLHGWFDGGEDGALGKFAIG
ncbi:capsule polysaccharide biosynthesis protein [Xylariomycetidae sp. FL0641]|nr:capsule polysaccharide biosynthesis protein [Xylariomycetidae sp. FL0641]